MPPARAVWWQVERKWRAVSSCCARAGTRPGCLQGSAADVTFRRCLDRAFATRAAEVGAVAICRGQLMVTAVASARRASSGMRHRGWAEACKDQAVNVRAGLGAWVPGFPHHAAGALGASAPLQSKHPCFAVCPRVSARHHLPSVFADAGARWRACLAGAAGSGLAARQRSAR